LTNGERITESSMNAVEPVFSPINYFYYYFLTIFLLLLVSLCRALRRTENPDVSWLASHKLQLPLASPRLPLREYQSCFSLHSKIAVERATAG
jgi:hypothetical protein